MTKTLLTFGDSNTYGTTPTATWGEDGRFGPNDRWPGVARSALGHVWTLIEEGLPGRTATPQPDPVHGAHLNGHLGLHIALGSHGPIDALTIMLGTNDCKAAFGQTPEMITGAVAGLLAIAKHPDMQAKHNGFSILLIAPPAIREEGTYVDGLWGAAAKSAALPRLYADLASHNRIGFLDAGEVITSCAEDGVHFDKAAHHTLGQVIAERIKTPA